MSGYPAVAPRPEMPEEFKFLCMLHNVGAITPERALNVEDIANWTNKEPDAIQDHLGKLGEMGYVQVVADGETKKYHVSVTGIRKVLTLYS